MKAVIIILVLVVIGFVVAIGVAVYRATTPPAPPAAHGPPTTSNGEIDEDALETWGPPPMAELLGKLSRPFAPKLLKKTVEISGQPGSGLAGDKPGELPIAASDKKMRVARLRLVEGRGAVATYLCAPAGKGETCDQVVCLCHENTVLEDDQVEACTESWRKARAIGDDKFSCKRNDDDVSAVIYGRGGVIQVTPMGESAATVSIR
ncbi:hypothetical protein J2800_004119 [Caulobacter rhizosphaerae]|uniref:Uncharacterized protein n=1 Tax=Caulobacter rhizosphaerae TaxID=2010972 RepID=A0ABU1N4K8_9CAUL|nr:hypothetical protein [Caulobacter rhizosphaerae]MDR6533357.1 hypothetical protein [Caulobacter rhizosphaerae]